MPTKKNDAFKASDYYKALSEVSYRLEAMREEAEDSLKFETESELKRRAEIRKEFDKKDDDDMTLEDYYRNDWGLTNTLRQISEDNAKIYVIDKILSSFE